VSVSTYHSCAIDDTGVVCWGDSTEGKTTVPMLHNPVAVSAAYRHTCALDDTGVVCWGYEPDGNPNVPALDFDKDLDGLQDAVEDANSNGSVDTGETDPLNPDSDDDGFTDGEEIIAGTDPLDPFSTPDLVVPGDVTGDGIVNVADVLVCTRIFMGLVSSANEAACDVAPLDAGGVPLGDGQLNAGDLSVLQRMVLGN